jgi:hypothetical protein
MHLIAEPSRLITCTIIKNCSVRCGFSSSNDDSAVKLTEDGKGGWHSLQPLGVQSEDYPTYDGALEVSGVWSVDRVLDEKKDQKRTRKLQNIKQHSWKHQKDWKCPEST